MCLYFLPPPSRLRHRLALTLTGRGDGEGGRGVPSCRAGAEPRFFFFAESLVATVTSPRAEAGRADWTAFAQRSCDSWLVVPGLECVVNQLAVFTYRWAHGGNALTWKEFLLR